MEFGDIIRWKYVYYMYGKATYTKVNQLRYGYFSQKYQGTSGQVLNAFDDVFLLLVLL